MNDDVFVELEQLIEKLRPVYLADKARFRDNYSKSLERAFPDVDCDVVLAWLEGVVPVGMTVFEES